MTYWKDEACDAHGGSRHCRYHFVGDNHLQ